MKPIPAFHNLPRMAHGRGLRQPVAAGAAVLVLGCLALAGPRPARGTADAPSEFDLVGGATTAVAIAPHADGPVVFAVVGARVVAYAMPARGTLREVGRTALLPEVPEDLALAGDLLYVAGRGPTGASAAWFHVYDIRDPAAMARLGTTTFQAGDVGAITVAYAHAYVLTDTGVVTLDVKSPWHPFQTATVATAAPDGLDRPWWPGGLAVVGRTLVVARPEGVFALDVDADPAHPRLAARVNALGSAYDAAASGSRVLVATEHGVALLAADDPRAPAVMASVPLTGRPRALAVAGDTAVVVFDGGQALARLHGLAAGRPEPDSRAELAAVASEDLAVALAGDLAVVAAGRTGLTAVAVDKPELGVWPAATAETIIPPVEAVDGAGRLVFAAAGPAGFFVLQDEARGLRALAALRPELAGSDGVLRRVAFHAVRHVDGTVYAATERHGLLAIDVRDPEHPTLGAPGLPVPGLSGPHELARIGRMLYVPGGDGALYAVDTGAPGGPAIVARLANLDGRSALALGGFVYVTAVGAFGLGHVHVIDARDARAPRYVRTLDLNRYFGHMAAGRGHLFLTGAFGELAVLNLADPSAPVEVYRGRNLDVGRAAVSGHMLVMARPEGLDSLDIALPAAPIDTGDPIPVPWGRADWPGTSDVVPVDGGLIVLRHQAGLLRLAGSPWVPSTAVLPLLHDGAWSPAGSPPELAPAPAQPAACPSPAAVAFVLDVSGAAVATRPAMTRALAAARARLAISGIASDVVTVDRQAERQPPTDLTETPMTDLTPATGARAEAIRLDLGLAAAERALTARGATTGGRIVLLLAGDPDETTWRLALGRARALRASGATLRAVQVGRLGPPASDMLPALAVLTGAAGHVRAVIDAAGLAAAVEAAVSDCQD